MSGLLFGSLAAAAVATLFVLWQRAMKDVAMDRRLPALTGLAVAALLIAVATVGVLAVTGRRRIREV